jgi:hypothetical protein
VQQWNQQLPSGEALSHSSSSSSSSSGWCRHPTPAAPLQQQHVLWFIVLQLFIFQLTLLVELGAAAAAAAAAQC